MHFCFNPGGSYNALEGHATASKAKRHHCLLDAVYAVNAPAVVDSTYTHTAPWGPIVYALLQ